MAKYNLYKEKLWHTATTYEEAYAFLEATQLAETAGGSSLICELGKTCSLATLGGNRMWRIDSKTGLLIAGVLTLRTGGLTEEQIDEWRRETKISVAGALCRLNES